MKEKRRRGRLKQGNGLTLIFLDTCDYFEQVPGYDLCAIIFDSPKSKTEAEAACTSQDMHLAELPTDNLRTWFTESCTHGKLT